MEIFGVFEGLVMCCILAVYKCVEERLKKDGVLTVEKRRLFPKKRRVSGAKTSFFESKDFVFFRKNAVFSSVDFFFVILKVSFTLKSLRNHSEIYAGSLVLHFHFIVKDVRGYDYRSC